MAGAGGLGMRAARAKKLNDEALGERLEEWICGGDRCAQIDTQGIGLLDVTSAPYRT